ncbi:hypothetical protein DFH29DRAFT_895636 [Suillus ampliporus]|nr:hypothetical protein DFH29DRAFT_895636 [Suillus ampliporus]
MRPGQCSAVGCLVLRILAAQVTLGLLATSPWRLEPESPSGMTPIASTFHRGSFIRQGRTLQESFETNKQSVYAAVHGGSFSVKVKVMGMIATVDGGLAQEDERAVIVDSMKERMRLIDKVVKYRDYI